MKFKVMYLKPKKKGFSEQTAVLLSIEDAVFWQDTVKKQGCQNIKIRPCFMRSSTKWLS